MSLVADVNSNFLLLYFFGFKFILWGKVQQLKPITIEESITGTAESPIVDVTKSGISTTFDKDLIEKIASGRFTLFEIIKQAPGFIQAGQDSGRTVAFGSNMVSIIYQLDGGMGTELIVTLQNNSLLAMIWNPVTWGQYQLKSVLIVF